MGKLITAARLENITSQRSIKQEMLRKIELLERIREAKRLPKFYSIRDLMIMFQCDEKTIRNLVEESKIHYFKVGKLIRFDPQDVEHYIRYHSTRKEPLLHDVDESNRLDESHLDEINF